MSESLPTVKFENLPIVQGPLNAFNLVRPNVLRQVQQRSAQELSLAHSSLDLLVGEALYSERQRIKRSRPNFYTRQRLKTDRRFWSQVQSSLVQPSALADRKTLLNQIIGHYAEEIGGHFNPSVYRFATGAVPLGFNWLLNAASVKRVLPWKQTESLKDNLLISGDVEALQRLSKKGTILLVPTHQSNIDSILIGYVIYLMSLPAFAYGAGLNLFSNPLLSFFMSNLGAYTVDRQKNSLIYKQTLKNYSTEILRSGIHSIFFPGGGRSRSGAVENKLKLGLLGTGLEAQIENLKAGKPQPNIYVVPMVMSYNFVLEASSLIEDFLAESGKHRFIIMDDESWSPFKVLNFFWKLFAAKSAINVRIGKPLDIFGNFVDEKGLSLGPNGTQVDPVKWLSTRGELRPEPQRDQEYTRQLGTRLVERFHKENTVLASHLVAFSLFEALRKQYSDLDVYRFLRLSRAQRTLPYDRFLMQLDQDFEAVRALADRGHLYLGSEFQRFHRERWIEYGIKNCGLLHDAQVIKTGENSVWTEDMTLLYYYRNRLAGYGLATEKTTGIYDRKGFLA